MRLFNKKTTDIPARRRQNDIPVREPAIPKPDQYTFQRNRTLTGSTSNKLSSTHHHTDLESPRTQAHHLAIQRRKICATLLTVVAIAAVLSFLLFQFTAKVTAVSGDSTVSRSVDSAVYETAINDYLGANPLERFRFALNESKLTSYLAQKLPEVESVSSVSSGGIGNTDIGLMMRRPVAGWTISDKQYFVDSHGIAFERNYYANPDVEIVDQSGISVQQGSAIASNRFLGFVGRVVALSKNSGYIVTQAIIPQNTTRQLEIKINGVTPLVKLSIDRPVGEQIEDMSKALGYLTSHGLKPSYVDVRVSGKAFYL